MNVLLFQTSKCSCTFHPIYICEVLVFFEATHIGRKYTCLHTTVFSLKLQSMYTRTYLHASWKNPCFMMMIMMNGMPMFAFSVLWLRMTWGAWYAHNSYVQCRTVNKILRITNPENVVFYCFVRRGAFVHLVLINRFKGHLMWWNK